ncbi:hypothetical protein C1752_06195 [Acaryochloris thomasi RCC1774]|uniref:Uncharacterized protein n=1 Tax=Acaryochloris thomasi RCC1774 TaxID=1764569 RepID=A0A2W1JJ99_9CYAN|nr:hypothetical protein [Acaryochloris thomasi]PZD71575.1 hypothetical protein C1752_06195 [Acaryochloris thomasi RCC1774]
MPQVKRFDIKGENGIDESASVGIHELIVKVDGQPFSEKSSAKASLTWYNSKNELQGYKVVPFLDGYALYKP